MLFGYPIEATAENWLHECLHEILQLIHTCTETGKSLPAWPEMVPVRYRKSLQKRTGLRDRLNVYQTALAKLSVLEQNRILQAFKDQNEIALLVSCQCDCEAVTDLPSEIHEPIKSLFEFAFLLLTGLGIRDKHYKIIYAEASHHICPFCGCEYFDAPGATREALDHYLPEHKYYFAGANLRNLVPMGNKCNSGYKLDQDILRKDDGTRRKSFYPYSHGKVAISLDKSQPFAGTIGTTGELLPKWEIEFSSNSEEVTTWDDVFHIRERYKRDVLDGSFNNWLNGFRAWCRDPRKQMPNSDREWLDTIEGYAIYHEFLGFEDRAFLKAAVFRMLHIHCKNGDQRLIQFIKDIVNDVSI
ncbi:MAG: hypothetical protein M1G31_26645 [Pseudanabaena sp. Salubria-1]|jgi:hypothetical protein|nr:hypothetical protein [Pseudanabaena sp. Salubria-1]